MKKTILAISMAALFFSCAKDNSQDAKMNEFIDKLMSEMTIEEKIGQLNLKSNWTYFQTNATLPEESEAIQQLKEGNMGAFYGFTNMKQIKQLQEIAMQGKHKIPLIFGNDVIHGFETSYPTPLAISNSWNMDLVEESARMAAKEASSVGINWVYSPMVDICRDARWGRIVEGGGEDPFLGGEIAKAYVRGYQGEDLSADNTVMVCVKHYALYGGAEAGRDYNSVFLSRQEALNGFMNPYKQAAIAGAGSYMSSFNEFEGIPATCNHYLLTEVLRDQWGFKGFVVSDATAVNEIMAHGIGDQQEVARRALQAGLDMDMGSDAFVKTLKKSYDEGKVSEEDINKACRRILEAKWKLGLFEDPYKYLKEGRDSVEIRNAEQLAFARKIAQECQVLLKNNGVLPLKKNAKIALIGPFADNAQEMEGAWAMSHRANENVTILQGVKEALDGGSVTYAKGSYIFEDEAKEEAVTYGLMKMFRPDMEFPSVHPVPQATLLAEAVRVARNADVIVACLGELNNMSGEGSSRSDISMPDAEENLLKALKATGKPLVLVLTTGRPLLLNWENENCDAILNTWNLGAEAGHAIADVLFGDVNPSGRLTTSFPRSNGQMPVYYNHKNTGRPHGDTDPYRKFVSCYMDVENGPLYYFGYGLSYTTFEYGDIKLSGKEMDQNGSITASITVKNTGEREGKETVQLYIHDIYSTSTRPVKELKGFQKINLKPGETKTVEFKITAEELKYYDHDLNFVCEPGDYEIMIGANSNDVKTATLTVK